jgi:hypothetical protein
MALLAKGEASMPVPPMATIAEVIFLGHAVGLLFASTSLLGQFGLDCPPAAVVMARRIGATFAGLSLPPFLFTFHGP